MENIKNIILVASGKGGVGKSTIASNLSVALCNKNKKVGLIDCDIHGPSIPRMFGKIDQKIIIENNKMAPLKQYGVKLMSIGFLVEETSAVIWRGPMLFKAIDQFFKDIVWGELDYLIVDLPPGTGDVQLTIAQKFKVTTSLIVTTPQNIALSDVIKSIDMFNTVKIPVLGVIENMSYFMSDSKDKLDLFPKGNLAEFLNKKNIPIIAKVPFFKPIAQGCEVGIPYTQSKSLEAFDKITNAVLAVS